MPELADRSATAGIVPRADGSRRPALEQAVKGVAAAGRLGQLPRPPPGVITTSARNVPAFPSSSVRKDLGRTKRTAKDGGLVSGRARSTERCRTSHVAWFRCRSVRGGLHDVNARRGTTAPIAKPKRKKGNNANAS